VHDKKHFFSSRVRKKSRARVEARQRGPRRPNFDDKAAARRLFVERQKRRRMAPQRAEITQAAQLRTDPARVDPDGRNRKTRTRESRTRQRLPVKIYEAHAGGPSGQPAASSAGSWIGSDNGDRGRRDPGPVRFMSDTTAPIRAKRPPPAASRRPFAPLFCIRTRPAPPGAAWIQNGKRTELERYKKPRYVRA
jgi:hypothetical protein